MQSINIEDNAPICLNQGGANHLYNIKFPPNGIRKLKIAVMQLKLFSSKNLG